jgi:hypothetical protein
MSIVIPKGGPSESRQVNLLLPADYDGTLLSLQRFLFTAAPLWNCALGSGTRCLVKLHLPYHWLPGRKHAHTSTLYLLDGWALLRYYHPAATEVIFDRTFDTRDDTSGPLPHVLA